jgi:hypothetical protein
MWQAINDIDLALHGENDIEQKRKLFEDARDDMMIQITMTVADLRQIGAAMDECNRIANSEEYKPC